MSWGHRINWIALRRRTEERRRLLARHNSGNRDVDWDLDFYATALRINAGHVLRPVVLVGRLIQQAIGVAIIAAFAYAVWMMVDHMRQPVEILDVKMLTPVVPPGGQIKVFFDIFRNQVCQVDPNWSVFGGDNEKFPFVAQHQDAGGPLGHDPFIRTFTLPGDIKPGHARFRLQWTWVCPLNYVDLQFPRAAPAIDVPFEIVAP